MNNDFTPGDIEFSIGKLELILEKNDQLINNIILKFNIIYGLILTTFLLSKDFRSLIEQSPLIVTLYAATVGFTLFCWGILAWEILTTHSLSFFIIEQSRYPVNSTEPKMVKLKSHKNKLLKKINGIKALKCTFVNLNILFSVAFIGCLIAHILNSDSNQLFAKYHIQTNNITSNKV